MLAEFRERVCALLGEGPQLFPDGALRWVDLLRGEVYVRSDNHSRLTATYPHEVSKVLPWFAGHLALTRAGIEAVTADGAVAWTLDLTGGDDSVRCSDGTVLPDGTVAVGIVDRDLRPGRGSLVRVLGDGASIRVVEGATIPNGIDVTDDGSALVWVDSPTRTLMRLAIDPDDGSLGAPRAWISLPEQWGVPDGLCSDDSGGVWVAMWGGARVIHIDATGSVDATIFLPVDHVTSVAFDVDNALIITSASIVLSESERASTPGAGGLWSVAAPLHGTRGLPPRVATLAPRGLPLAFTSNVSAP